MIEKIANHQPFGADRPINKSATTEAFYLLLTYKDKKGGNYEELLSQIQALSEDYSKSQSDKDSYSYVFGLLYEIIHKLLSLYQSESYKTLYPLNFKWFSKLENLLQPEETWIFTLNHDIFLECLAIDLGIPITYGDLGKIEFPKSNLEMDEHIEFSTIERNDYSYNNPGFFAGKKGINLVKLHGGLSEHEYKNGSLLCNQNLIRNTSKELMDDFHNIMQMAFYHQGTEVPGGRDRTITNKKGELDIISKAMLTGGKKYSKTANHKKGEEKLAIFDKALSEIDELTIIGYGLGDKHVNFRIANAMARRENLSIKIIDPIHRQIPEFLEPFDYNSRVTRATCGAAHWIDYCKNKKWNAEQIEALKENAGIRIKIIDQVKSAIKSGRI